MTPSEQARKAAEALDHEFTLSESYRLGAIEKCLVPWFAQAQCEARREALDEVAKALHAEFERQRDRARADLAASGSHETYIDELECANGFACAASVERRFWGAIWDGLLIAKFVPWPGAPVWKLVVTDSYGRKVAHASEPTPLAAMRAALAELERAT